MKIILYIFCLMCRLSFELSPIVLVTILYGWQFGLYVVALWITWQMASVGLIRVTQEEREKELVERISKRFFNSNF